MKVLISTTRRHTPIGQPSGYLFVFDIEKNKVIRQCEIAEPPYMEKNPNPRGGLRGLKGISTQGNEIALANSSTIFMYVSSWEPIRSIWHPSCAAIHELALDNNVIWVTSACNDLLLCFNYQGKLIRYYDTRMFVTLLEHTNWRPKPFLTEKQILNGEINFRDPRTHTMVKTDHAHTNSVQVLPNGDLLVSCGLLKNSNFTYLLAIKYWLLKAGIWKRLLTFNQLMRKTGFGKIKETAGEMIIQPAKGYSAVVQIDPKGQVKTCLSFFGASVPSHSARFLKDESAVYLYSSRGEIIHFNPKSGETISTTSVGERFLRGVCQLPDGTLLLGDNNYFIHFDVNEKRIISKTKLSDDNTVAIFDFCILPDHFNLPPESFTEHHKNYPAITQL